MRSASPTIAANIGITGKEISIETKVKTIRPLKIKLKIIFNKVDLNFRPGQAVM